MAALFVFNFGAMTITVGDDVGSGDGGAFLVTVTGDPIYGHGTGSTFQTFCIETSEYLNFGGTYEIALNTAAIYNGVPFGNNPLDTETAWIYTQWLNGSISHTVTNAMMFGCNLVYRRSGANNAIVSAIAVSGE
jgi:hypothetical protein